MVLALSPGRATTKCHRARVPQRKGQKHTVPEIPSQTHHTHEHTNAHTNTHMLNRYCTLPGNHSVQSLGAHCLAITQCNPSVHTAWQSLTAITRCTLLGPLPTATPLCTAHLGRCLRSRESECESRSSWFRGHNSCRHSTWTTRHQKPLDTLDRQCNAGCAGLRVWLSAALAICLAVGCWLPLCACDSV
jgi:hypothetical protein